jgi:nitrogen fixation/metabolism regulation signal transduction histidine kinase
MSEEKEKIIHRRKQFIVEKRFQHRVIWQFVGVVIVSIFTSHIITIAYFKIKEMIAPSSQDLMYFANTINETLAFSRVVEILWVPLLISALVGSVLIISMGIFFSHRIAGPLFNLKRMMKQIEKGNLNVTMRIRKDDEFHDVEDAFNQMVKGLQSHLRKLETAVAGLSGSHRTEMQKILRELNILDSNE